MQFETVALLRLLSMKVEVDLKEVESQGFQHIYLLELRRLLKFTGRPHRGLHMHSVAKDLDSVFFQHLTVGANTGVLEYHEISDVIYSSCVVKIDVKLFL